MICLCRTERFWHKKEQTVCRGCVMEINLGLHFGQKSCIIYKKDKCVHGTDKRLPQYAQ
jgi:hypothetical protein